MTQTQLPNFDRYWNYSKPEETRKKFSEIFQQHQSEYPSAWTLELQTQIARTYSLQAKFEEAHRELDAVQGHWELAGAKTQVRYYLERGRTHNSAGEKTKAKELFMQSFELAKESNLLSLQIDAAHMLAIASPELDQKMKWNTLGLEAAKNSDDPKARRWIGSFYNNMGWDLFEAKRYDQALNHFTACQEFHKTSGNADRLSIAKWSIAKTYRMQGKVEESLSIQKALLEETGGENSSGYGYEELGELYLIKKDLPLSQKYFSKAYQILSQDVWLQKNEADRLARIKSLSQ